MVIRVADAGTLETAVQLLLAGQVVGMPTETVYGLAADAANPEAVARIFAMKGRPLNHPVIVHVADAEHAARWSSSLPAQAQALMQAFWPGPLTLIVPRAAHVSTAVTGGQDTVGLRCPSHPVAQALLKAFVAAGGSGGLAAPSANRFGRISPTLATHVTDEFGDGVPLVLEGGACQVGIESTIVDVSRGEPVVLRPGAITAAQIAECLSLTVGEAAPKAPLGPAPRVSGDLAAHYAPRTPLEVLERPALLARLHDLAGQPLAVWAPAPLALAGVDWRAAPDTVADYSHQLYATLREFDDGTKQRILLQIPPDEPAWLGVRDRLGRAAVGSGPG